MEQLLMELRESREEIARLREEIETTKVSCVVSLPQSTLPQERSVRQPLDTKLIILFYS